MNDSILEELKELNKNVKELGKRKKKSDEEKDEIERDLRIGALKSNRTLVSILFSGILITALFIEESTLVNENILFQLRKLAILYAFSFLLALIFLTECIYYRSVGVKKRIQFWDYGGYAFIQFGTSGIFSILAVLFYLQYESAHLLEIPENIVLISFISFFIIWRILGWLSSTEEFKEDIITAIISSIMILLFVRCCL